jgi:hypothetical protein
LRFRLLEALVDAYEGFYEAYRRWMQEAIGDASMGSIHGHPWEYGSDAAAASASESDSEESDAEGAAAVDDKGTAPVASHRLSFSHFRQLVRPLVNPPQHPPLLPP